MKTVGRSPCSEAEAIRRYGQIFAVLNMANAYLREELNEAEQDNIVEGWEWASARRRNVLDEHLLLLSMGRPSFSWGLTSLVDAGDTRRHYVEALRTADRQDCAPLKEFVRS